ncbi:MAG: DUF4823 domain-containing protein [Pseudomonadales bacterium]|jgi:hypothetical protein|uniref:DUF4823 domain-containing protein n=1 Tax=Halopseudomonas TaxID=2901189 RepID=UPI000C4D07C1|nr:MULTISPECIES: DUF4823 domain-containing protein [Halopseudomonas]MAD27868.1 DUF4823 domain-containing protein [Pseudomonadales bacterium]MDX1299706.1 DUF4823 domain-containing protein [Pseudomonas sp.]MAK74216.1 DUF4823 domain-containing protein [Pseudomonadales bacterium]MAP77787.1 DUF4823 domain-containing protein [Pseudomonadales bacterium]MAS66958.1 DUF4823 domain-containing protein [Pseudomonadales bacterium]|tara:strand:- start:2583 stop:3179 length:597 start_codon:yes stop_codon:yes gene_type:complete
MRYALMLLAVLLLSGCMKPSDLQDQAGYYLGDAGVLNHYRIKRSSTWVIQSDSKLYIAQGHFLPVGNPYARPNVVAEEAFAAAVEVFPVVRRAQQPLGLEEALAEARSFGYDYLLYTRFAAADDAVGSIEEWEESGQWGDLGLDRGVLQLMLLEVGTRHLVDFARIETRGGFLQFYKASPEDLLRPPLQDYTGQLLGR